VFVNQEEKLDEREGGFEGGILQEEARESV